MQLLFLKNLTRRKNEARATEKAVAITTSQNISEIPADTERIYLGDEFCERLLPHEKDIKTTLRFCQKEDMQFTLVTPYLTEHSLLRAQKLLTMLPEGSEVVINDYGLLSAVTHEKRTLVPILGRLLAKQKRDNRTLLLRDKIPSAAWEYFQEANINVREFQNFLHEQGIHRVEIDNLVQGTRLKPGQMHVTLHVPYVYVTTTRLCLVAGCDAIDKRREVSITRPCNRECLKYLFTLEDPSFPSPLFMKGNAQFYRNETIPEQGELNKIDRIVEHRWDYGKI